MKTLVLLNIFLFCSACIPELENRRNEQSAQIDSIKVNKDGNNMNFNAKNKQIFSNSQILNTKNRDISKVSLEIVNSEIMNFLNQTSTEIFLYIIPDKVLFRVPVTEDYILKKACTYSLNLLIYKKKIINGLFHLDISEPYQKNDFRIAIELRNNNSSVYLFLNLRNNNLRNGIFYGNNYVTSISLNEQFIIELKESIMGNSLQNININANKEYCL